MAVGLGVIVMTSIIALLFALQTRLIFPGAATQRSPEARVVVPVDAELLRLSTRRGDRIAAIFGPALTEEGSPHPDARNRPTLLYFYGNGNQLRYAAEDEFDRFRKLGTNMLIAEYVGYGLSEGAPGEIGCYETADAAYEHLLTRDDIDPKLIIAAGRSIGGAVAIDLAARRQVAGLVAFCTFTRMGAMVRRQFPFVPTMLLLRHKFDSLGDIGRVKCPILLGHGAEDRFVPPWMSKSLAEAAKASVTTFFVPGANHNDFYAVGEKQILKELGAFIEKVAERKFEPAR